MDVQNKFDDSIISTTGFGEQNKQELRKVLSRNKGFELRWDYGGLF